MSKQVTQINSKDVLTVNGKMLTISKPSVMSIVNLTPDSFYDGGKQGSFKKLLKRVEKDIDQGCSILDLGAESTRPGSEPVGVEEELKRLLPALKLIRNTFPEIIISIDTYRSETAIAAAEQGADMINDISSGAVDENMLETVAELKLPYIAMHMKGTPKTMQVKPVYKNVVKEVNDFFTSKLKECKAVGIKNAIIDPGFGFGKTLEHNYELLNKLEELKKHKVPVLVGVSRKGMIQKVLNCDAEHALNGTSVVNTIALLKGASILRVHDVKEAMEAIKIVNQIKV
jgi:dihydropteroate synthase